MIDRELQAQVQSHLGQPCLAEVECWYQLNRGLLAISPGQLAFFWSRILDGLQEVVWPRAAIAKAHIEESFVRRVLHLECCDGAEVKLELEGESADFQAALDAFMAESAVENELSESAVEVSAGSLEAAATPDAPNPELTAADAEVLLGVVDAALDLSLSSSGLAADSLELASSDQHVEAGKPAQPDYDQPALDAELVKLNKELSSSYAPQTRNGCLVFVVMLAVGIGGGLFLSGAGGAVGGGLLLGFIGFLFFGSTVEPGNLWYYKKNLRDRVLALLTETGLTMGQLQGRCYEVLPDKAPLTKVLDVEIPPGLIRPQD